MGGSQKVSRGRCHARNAARPCAESTCRPQSAKSKKRKKWLAASKDATILPINSVPRHPWCSQQYNFPSNVFFTLFSLRPPTLIAIPSAFAHRMTSVEQRSRSDGCAENERSTATERLG